MALFRIMVSILSLQNAPAWLPVFALATSLQISGPTKAGATVEQPENRARIASEDRRGANSDSVIAVLRAQLSERRESDDRLLTTVFWSLGTIAGVSVLLFGFGWWSNFRVYERDKTSLKQDLERSISEEFGKLHSSSRDELDKLRAVTQEELTRFQVNMRSDLDAYRQGVDARLTSIRDDLTQAVDRKVSGGVAPMKEEIRALNGKILSVNIDVVDAEVERWTEKKVWDNALRAALRVISLARQAGEEWRVTRTLEAVTRFVNAGGGTDSFTYGQIIDVLDGLSEAHALDVSNIKRTLQENRSKRAV